MRRPISALAAAAAGVTAVAVAAATTVGAVPAGAQPAADRITVYAASSLADVFPKIAAGPRYQFAGSNALAAQIANGAPADVFASANTTLPAELHARGLVGKPVVFTRNALVLVVPRGNPARIRTVYDLKRDGIKLDVAAPSVPVGGYTVEVLKNLKLTSVLANVVSQETDVREVLSKVALGEADAGFVYATDARTVRGKVTVLNLPARAQPKIAYSLAVVASSARKAAAQRFVAAVLGRAGQARLAAAGFLPRVQAKPAPKK